MKHLFTSVLLAICLLLSTESLLAQSKHGFAYRFNWLNYITPREDFGANLADRDLGKIYQQYDWHAMEFAYSRYFNDGQTSLTVPLKVGFARFPTNSRQPEGGTRDFVTSGDLLLQHSLFRPDRFIFNPYFHFGLGTLHNWESENWDLNMPIGIGVNIRLAEDFYLNAQTQYRESNNKRSGWHHGVGVLLNFGNQVPPPPPPPADRDGDGIPDLTDACPDEIGTSALNGCPDRDGDTIADKDDKCPDVAGVSTLMGCPDRDLDGIADADDACPDQKGVVAFKGCPDTDGDGIQDKDDKCPREKGTAALKGCPDTDGDGIADSDDACPKEKGPAATKGCPDADADGVADKDDACPNKKGDPAHKGCPDTDKDGTYDHEDRCVDKPGPASNKGCPELKKEDKKKLDNVIRNVQFETGKATLLTKSYTVLDEVVKLMSDYPEYSLAISGHTDSQGDDKTNQTLSEQRAKACYDYLVSKGVAAARMSHTGYGETKPIADNATKAGRDANRRVDFDLSVK
jgi:outer membrane protein OmpA-like peptidoglycan-associated protein